MDIRTLTTAATLLILGSGCTGMKFGKSENTSKVPEGVPVAPLSKMAQSDPNTVVQASGTMPTTGSGQGVVVKPVNIKPVKGPASEIQVMWRNRIDYLPDPSNNGEMSPGLAGQMFLFGPGMLPAQVDGKLIIALYDETPRPQGQPANKPECWAFDKETLKKLVTMDERFGSSFALFLPWPTYRLDVTKIRVAARYEPEQGNTLYAAETKITIDTSAPGATPTLEWTNQTVVPGAQPGGNSSLLGGPPPSSSIGLGMIPSGPITPPAGMNVPGSFGSQPAPFGLQPQGPANNGMAPPGRGMGMPIGIPLSPR